MDESTTFLPDWLSAPGESISDHLAEQNISAQDFASLLKVDVETTNRILNGSAPITAAIANALSMSIGGTPEFWLRREEQYHKDLVRLRQNMVGDSVQTWLRNMPVNDMTSYGWVPKMVNADDQAVLFLKFFGVNDVGEWQEKYKDSISQPSFRTSPSFVADPAAVIAWLRQGERESSAVDCLPWNAERFASSLLQLRELTREKDPEDFLPQLRAQCAASGVAVAIVRSPSGCHASGATRFLTPQKAMLLLSFRFLSDDHFWFTFFHEAGHLLLHGQSALFYESDDRSLSDAEQEANEFAADVLIPPNQRAAMCNLDIKDGREIIRFARRIGIAPGIVVGQLQHFGRVRRNHFNNLKRRFCWKDS